MNTETEANRLVEDATVDQVLSMERADFDTGQALLREDSGMPDHLEAEGGAPTVADPIIAEIRAADILEPSAHDSMPVSGEEESINPVAMPVAETNGTLPHHGDNDYPRSLSTVLAGCIPVLWRIGPTGEQGQDELQALAASAAINAW